MNRVAQFESSGLKNKASKKRKPAAPLPDLMDFSADEDLEELLEAEIDTGQDIAPPKPKRQKPAQRPASRQTAKKKSQRPSPRQAPVRSRLPQRKSPSHDLNATAAPLLATVGVLLLIPAFWALLLLVGVGVPGSAREDSRPMAAVMLACWPIAICLIATAVVFFKQLARAKREMKQAQA